jgi:hypothetical protein
MLTSHVSDPGISVTTSPGATLPSLVHHWLMTHALSGTLLLLVVSSGVRVVLAQGQVARQRKLPPGAS